MSNAPPLPGGAFFLVEEVEWQRLPAGGDCFHRGHHGSALSFGGFRVAVEFERGRTHLTRARQPSICAPDMPTLYLHIAFQPEKKLTT